MDDLYREIILDHYHNPHNFGRLKNPDHSLELNNPFCGDKICIDIRMQRGTVKDIMFSGEGCAISTASASMLTDRARSAKISHLQSLTKDDIVNMLGVTLTPTRLKCALLPLEVLQKIFAGIK